MYAQCGVSAVVLTGTKRRVEAAAGAMSRETRVRRDQALSACYEAAVDQAIGALETGKQSSRRSRRAGLLLIDNPFDGDFFGF